MAFSHIGAKAISHRSLKAKVAVRAYAQLSRHTVDTIKSQPREFLQQPIWIILRKSDGCISHQVINLYYVVV